MSEKTGPCPTCNAPAPIDEHDALRCPRCVVGPGTVGHLLRRLQSGEFIDNGRSVPHGLPAAHHAAFHAFRRLVTQRWGGLSVDGVQALRSWMHDQYNWSNERSLVMTLAQAVELLEQETQPTADKKTDSPKKIPSDPEILKAAKFINEWRSSDRPQTSKTAMLSEFCDGNQAKIDRLNKALQPSRYGWLIGERPDK